MYSVNGIFLKPKYKVYGETSIFYFNAPFFSTPRQEPTNQETVLFTTLVLQDQPQGCILSYFFKLFRVLFLQNACGILSDFCGKNVSICGVHIPRKCIESIHFSHVSVLHSKRQVEFFENLLPQGEKGGGNYNLLYQNSIRKYEDDLKEQFVYILYDL